MTKQTLLFLFTFTYELIQVTYLPQVKSLTLTLSHSEKFSSHKTTTGIVATIHTQLEPKKPRNDATVAEQGPPVHRWIDSTSARLTCGMFRVIPSWPAVGVTAPWVSSTASKALGINSNVKAKGFCHFQYEYSGLSCSQSPG